MLTNKKITAFSKIVAGLPDVPSPAMSALQLKQHFDTAPEEMRVAFNALIDNLLSTATGDSGAESIGIEPIVGVSAANVQNALEQLKLLINSASTGAIPDGSLGLEKLSFDAATQAELDAHNADTVKHVPYALATGTANTYVATLTPAPTSYTRGMALSVEINVLNTGASTINVNSLGAKTIKKSNGNDVSAGQLKVGIIYTLRYNGTNFILQGEGGSGNALAGDLLLNKTASTDAGDIVGSIPVRNGVLTGVTNNAQTIANGQGDLILVPPYGFYDEAANTQVKTWDPNFVPANIVGTIFGLQGTARKMKNGTATTVQTSSFYHKITVAGLGFQPKWVIAFTNIFGYSQPGFTGTSALIIPFGDLMTSAIYNTHMKDTGGSTIAQEYWTTQGTAENQFQVTTSGFTMIVAKMNASVPAQNINWIAFGD